MKVETKQNAKDWALRTKKQLESTSPLSLEVYYDYPCTKKKHTVLLYFSFV